MRVMNTVRPVLPRIEGDFMAAETVLKHRTDGVAYGECERARRNRVHIAEPKS